MGVRVLPLPFGRGQRARARGVRGIQRLCRMPAEALLAIAGILGALAVGVVSPGPSFVLVARTAVALSRRDGLAASIGMGLGGVIFAALALAGLIAVLAQVP